MPVALLLAWCAAGGFDIRHAIIEACINWLGYDFAWDIIQRRVLFGSYLASLAGPVIGPVDLLSVLMAMHLAPRRWSWWQWALVVVWLGLHPWMSLELARLLPPRVCVYLGMYSTPLRRVAFVGNLVGLTLVGMAMLSFLMRRMAGPFLAREGLARSLWRFAPLAYLALGSLTAFAMWWYEKLVNASVVTPMSPEAWLVLASLWHVGSGAIVIGYSLAARRAARTQSSFCEVCNYDLRGLPSGAVTCPECGKALTAHPRPATPTHPGPRSPASPAA